MKANSAESPLHWPGSLFREIWHDGRASTGLATWLLRARLAQLYRHSALGLMWAVVPTVAIVIGVSLSVSGADTPAPGAGAPIQVHVAFGVVLMQTFVESFNGQRSIFDLHQNLLQRVRFPTEAVLLAQIAESGFSFLVKLPVLLIVLVIYGVPLQAQLLLGLLACVPVWLAGVAAGAVLAPVSSLGKDLDRLMGFLPWLVFLATPVFYRTPSSGDWAAFHAANPLTALLDGARHLCYGADAPQWTTFWSTLALVFIGLVIGLVICKLAPPHLAARMQA